MFINKWSIFPVNQKIKHKSIPEQSSKTSHKRKQKLILPKLQLSLIFTSIIIFILASVIYFATVNIVFLKLNHLGIELGLKPNSSFFKELSSLESITAKIYGITVFVGLLTSFFIGLKLSHKVAGSIYCFNKHIKNVCNGKTNEDVRFRKNDYLLELQDNFNLLMEKYRNLQK